MGEIGNTNYAECVHVKLGKGPFIFLAGQDPEDDHHLAGEEQIPTNLQAFAQLPTTDSQTNTLFPAVRKGV